MPRFDCLSFGSSAFDVLMSVDRPPRSDERISAHSVTSGGGGPASTASTAMARLGLTVGLVTAVGQDVFGDLMVSEFERFGVENSGIQRVTGSSTISSVLIERETAHRSMVVYGGCINRIDLDAIDFDRIREARLVHLDGNNPMLALRAARRARELGVTTSLDGGNMSAEALAPVLPFIDIYIPDEQSMRRQLRADISIEDACRAYHVEGPTLVCITRAEHGSVAFDGERFWTQPVYSGVAVVDTTGAGDNFHGAFLAARLEGQDLDHALRFANTYAALCCRGVGGRATAPDMAETLEHVARFPGLAPDTTS
ncbi:carbohydrate kinase family protein [Bradyrhizobium sp.]|uniref:carbohydrate kinase family protein n=1 Tax=Bradyrhizobium sp. TaxID=376 RepID=UPI0039E330ED